MHQSARDRYPGIRSFEASERRLFFGREAETDDLFGLAKTRSLVVMFAKSGIGKSSLINAGVVPKLEADGFFPVPVRFQNTASNPLDIMDRVLAWHIDHALLDKFAPAGSSTHLWHKIKASKFEGGRTPIFIFDQFEEFFNHPASERAKFAQQLADLADHRLPEIALEALQSIPRPARTAEQLAWYTPANVRFLIALRSDRLSELNEMTAAIPSVLQNRFELRPLNSAQARLAITQPAQLEGDFASPTFTFQEDTLRDMLENLSSARADEIESFQLQILCGEIEKKIKAVDSERRTADGNNSKLETQNSKLTVTPDYLGGKAGISNILNNYYENQIVGLHQDEHEKLARHLIEDQLIADNKRVGVAVETVKLPPDLVEKLLLSRLIRRAPTHLGDVFEISHDTLVEPIAKSRDLRRLVEEKERLERERLEREQELAEQTRRLEQERQLRTQAEQAQQEADTQRQKAETALAEAELLRQKAERNAGRAFWFSVLCVVLLLPLVLFYWSLNTQFQRGMAEAAEQQRNQKFEDAAGSYQALLDDRFFKVLFYNDQPLVDSIAQCRRMADIQKKVQEADAQFFNGEYYRALGGYDAAQKLGFAGLEDKIENTKRIRDLSLDIYTRKAETFYDAEAYDLACEYVERAWRLDPEGEYLKRLRARILPKCK